jgi:DNA-directed RNA polymerase subunit N (RpoN/RPB10)
MDEKQEVCFTCGTKIRAKLYEYERYRDVYGLSRTDAADKTQLHNICCRTTAFGQTGVERRIAAAGQVSTVENSMRVEGIKPYPKARVTRTYGEGPFKNDSVQLSPKVHEKMNYSVYSGLQPDISSIPERNAFGTAPQPPKPEDNKTSNRDLVGDLSTLVNGKWTLIDKSTFPEQEKMQEVFTKKNVVIHLVCPILSAETLHILEITKGTKVVEALDRFEGAMVTTLASLGNNLTSNNVIKAPQRLVVLLGILRSGKNLSIVDFSRNTMIVSRVYRDTKRKVYVIEMRHLEPIKIRRTRLEEDILKETVEEHIENVTGALGGNIVMTIGRVKVTFTEFQLHTKTSQSSVVSEIPLRAKFLGVHIDSEGKLLMSFMLKAELYVLMVTGQYSVKDVDRIIQAPDTKREKIFKLLESL